MPEHERNFSITAFIVGGLLGASSLLLLSPKSGKDIREDIKLKADNYLNKARTKSNNLIRNSRSSAELLKSKAEEMMNTVQKYAKGKIDKPVSVIEKEIAGLKAALNAAKTSYSLNPELHESNQEENNDEPSKNDFEDETLPKHIGMGKGRNRDSYYS
jgi:gas vesicle protein